VNGARHETGRFIRRTCCSPRAPCRFTRAHSDGLFRAHLRFPAFWVSTAPRASWRERLVGKLRGVSSPDSHRNRRLERYLLTANVLDQMFRVPGTKWRFGIDAILGLLPGAGDLATAVVGAYGIVVAQQLGAPRSIQTRMLVNLLIDAGIGTIPLLGDIFDFGFKANVRNARLLTDWLTRRGAS
jgi:hypothetical protein